MKKLSQYAFGMLGVWILALASSIYTAITGNAIFSDVHYNTAGRIVGLLVTVAIGLYWVYLIFGLKKLEKKR